MRNKKKKVIAIALAVAGLAVLTGCGKSEDTAAVPGPVAGVPGTQYGLPGSGYCVPVDQPIPFVGTNVFLGSLSLKAGQSPASGQSYGTMQVGGGGAGPYTDSGVDGTLMMNIQPIGGNYYGNFTPGSAYGNMTANISGVVTIAPATIQDLIARNALHNGGTTGIIPQPGYGQPGYPGYGYPTTSVPCVSGIAIGTGFVGASNPTAMFGTSVYLYMNNTTLWYKLSI